MDPFQIYTCVNSENFVLGIYLDTDYDTLNMGYGVRPQGIDQGERIKIFPIRPLVGIVFAGT